MNENQNRKNILLVDDDPDYSELTRTRLEATGYRVSCVSNGRQALDLLKDGYQPNLMILDIDMPDKNGLTTLINMNVRKKSEGQNTKFNIPIIVATGLQSEKVKEVISAQEITSYLKKPYDSEVMIQTIKRLIG